MSGILFLYGILIKDIQLDKSYQSAINCKSYISINVRFSDYMNVDIDLEDLLTDEEKAESMESVEDIEINMGKSYLFSSNFKDVLAEMKKYPLEITICLQRKREGTIFHRWRQEFINLVKKAETITEIKPCYISMRDNFRNSKNTVIGSCDFLLQFICFNHIIQHSFFIDIVGQYDEYINDYSKNAFKCFNFEKLISEQAELPLYTVSCSSVFAKDDIYFKGVGVEDLDDKVEKGTTPDSEIPDAVSLCFRPPENKYFDLMGMFTVDVSTTPRGTCVTLTMDKQAKAKYVTEEEEKTREQVYPFDSTEEQINKNLCKSKDCPAAMKLKEFGFGPLATSKALGTIYGDVKCTTSYGMSQTYGTFCRYGPYGVLLDDAQQTAEEVLGTDQINELIDEDNISRHIQFLDRVSK